MQYFPSNPRGHLVVQDTILDAWKEVLHLLTRFGRRVNLEERANAWNCSTSRWWWKSPASRPTTNSGPSISIPDKLRLYQEEILSGEMRPDETYNYGHRLRSYFDLDTLAACAERLKHDPEDRKSYVTLWDNARDLTVKEGRPCLVSLYFPQV